MKPRKGIYQRFWEKVSISTGTESCWLWKGQRNRKGYGLFKRTKRFQDGAHRVAWELAHGVSVPFGLHVLHSCDNPPCCNPAHLFTGTSVDNVRDMVAKRRNRFKGWVRGQRGDGPNKITRDQAELIREMYATKQFSQRTIAKQFEISQPMVGKILRGDSW